jgi:hypothetical protein
MISQLLQLRECTAIQKMTALTSATEDNNFFPLAYYKDQERIRKRIFFSANGIKKIIVITNLTNFINFSSVINGHVIHPMPEKEFSGLAENVSRCREILDGAVVILTNNNVAKIGVEKAATIIEASPNTIFAIHDFDNHHWHEHSLQCALLADIYAPAHLSDFAIAGRINSALVAGIPCGSIQWNKQFMLLHLPEMLNNQRKSEPLGMHTYYGKFKYRNSILATVNKVFPSVGFLKQDFHERSDLERWQEWISYPVHWIAPVFNDLPLRFFDSLITGGIPLVPNALAPYLNFLKIPENFYICYSPTDLINTNEFVKRALIKFEDKGAYSRLERHAFAIENYHVDEILYKLYSHAADKFVGRPKIGSNSLG